LHQSHQKQVLTRERQFAQLSLFVVGIHGHDVNDHQGVRGAAALADHAGRRGELEPPAGHLAVDAALH